MATASPAAVPRPRRPDRRRLVLAGVVAALLLLGWFWKPLNGYASAGAAFGARTACSCRYIAGRSLRGCAKDFEPGMALIWLSADARKRSVTARFPLLTSETATFREGEGCVLEPWRD